MFEKGQILVATRTQYFDCGKTMVHMDAIVKAANYEDESTKTIIVYISKEREKNDVYFRVKTDDGKMRLATPKEIEMWEAGVRNCRGELV